MYGILSNKTLPNCLPNLPQAVSHIMLADSTVGFRLPCDSSAIICQDVMFGKGRIPASHIRRHGI